MKDYLKEVKDFLRRCQATCEIVYGGITRNENWKEKEKRNWYDVTLTTPKGTMSYTFWDSIRDTEISQMSLKQYAEKKYGRYLHAISFQEQMKAKRELQKAKAEAVPTESDVLLCLQTYDVGGFEDFCADFGYDDDSISALKLYHAVDKEFRNLARIFTEAQLEDLRKIQTE